MTIRTIIGDCRSVLPTLADDSVHCVVTSPPYWGLRDYGVAGQIGLEPTYQAFIAEMVAVFREVRRVLRPDGTLWLNLGDAYAGSWGAQGRGDKRSEINSRLSQNQIDAHPKRQQTGSLKKTGGCKAKDLMGIPWRVAFALQEDGWWLRQDIIWSKPNPMPESVTDRCTKSHEYIFFMSKSARYFYDAEAIKEAATYPEGAHSPQSIKSPYGQGFTRNAPLVSEARKELRSDVESRHRSAIAGGQSLQAAPDGKRNKRSVWEIATSTFPEAHFATFPPALVEPCIKAGCPKGGTVLDPFGGAGTTGLAADRLQRNAILIELNPKYADMAQRRITADAPLFAEALNG